MHKMTKSSNFLLIIIRYPWPQAYSDLNHFFARFRYLKLNIFQGYSHLKYFSPKSALPIAEPHNFDVASVPGKLYGSGSDHFPMT
jgi:hypothetical protein